jgi:UDP-N-acetylglucosamine/UDP-N-acetylgalactosamine diphosphorylase
MAHDVQALKKLAEAHGQGHLFAFYGELSSASQQKLLDEIAALDFDVLDRLIDDYVKRAGHLPPLGKLEPAPVFTLPKSAQEKNDEQDASAKGEEALRQGRVGCFLVAGGQGTRLGLNGPKGAFVIGPATDRTLFQIHAEKIMALRRRYKALVPWLIMTSDANDTETKEFLAKHNFYGLDADTVCVFKQGNMPAVGRDGKILMQAKDGLALSPNGHGGSIKALWDSGTIAWLKSKGVDTLSYFQVDNPLVKIGDPLFIGRHVCARSQMSTKVCRKRDWKEKVGVLALRDGKLCVIEYSDLPENLAKETSPDGSLRWWAGSIAIHVLNTGFIEQLNQGGFRLPYHKAEKAVPCIGPDGQPAQLKPGEKNGIKFETFVFDALTQTERAVNMETRREEDFSPVKNAQGEDSPETCKRDMMEQYARWLTAAGVKVPRKSDGSLDCVLEISPLTSLYGEDLDKAAPKAIRQSQQVVL